MQAILYIKNIVKHFDFRVLQPKQMHFTFTVSRSESNSVLSLVLSKLRYTYSRNPQNKFYLLVYFNIESEIAVKSYKQYKCMFYLHKSIFCSFYNVHRPPIKMVYLSHDLVNFLTYFQTLLFHIAVLVLQCSNSKIIFNSNINTNTWCRNTCFSIWETVGSRSTLP